MPLLVTLPTFGVDSQLPELVTVVLKEKLCQQQDLNGNIHNFRLSSLCKEKKIFPLWVEEAGTTYITYSSFFLTTGSKVDKLPG